jgi:hypothetical protein
VVVRNYSPQKHAYFGAQRACAIDGARDGAGSRAGVLDGAPRRRETPSTQRTKPILRMREDAFRAGSGLRNVETDFHDATNRASANHCRVSVHVCAIVKPDAAASEASVDASCLYELSV